MLAEQHNNYAMYSAENDGQQQSQLLGEGSEGRILPPPSSWFTDDLLAAAAPPSDSDSCVSQEERKEDDGYDEEDAGALLSGMGDEGDSCVRANLANTTNHFDSISNEIVLSANSKTPPLASFRLDPTLSPPRVVAAPSPSWKEISSEVLPSTAKELLSSSLSRICYTARISWSKGRWHRKYTELGNNSGGYFRPDNNSSFFESTKQQLPVDLPPFSSLPWVDRQMVREWRTYLPEEKPSGNHEEEDVDFDRARTLVPQPMPRPVWQKAEICSACRKPFGPTRLRHHCRLCGYSFCQLHSANAHRLPHLGYDSDVPERVCDPCKRGLLAQNLAERVAWRLARCRDLEAQQLTPYFETGIDTMEEAAIRIAHAALATARSIPLGAQAHVAVETVEVLRKHGLNGIYGFMLRKEFLAAADLLRKALGINKTAWPLSVHELSAAIFYALAQHRAMRGINPDREEIIHTLIDDKNTTAQGKQTKENNAAVIDATDDYNPDIERLISLKDASVSDPKSQHNTALANGTLQKDTFTCSSESELPFAPVCTPVADHALNSLIFYAPLALTFIYATKAVDMQLLAAQQGWKLLYACLYTEKDEAVKDMPASAIFVHEQQKTACLAIRGTATIHDVVTDVRQMPVSFPEMDLGEWNHPEGWTNVSQGNGLAVCGMASASLNLFREHIDAILHLVREGYRIRITGHSLGGGVAALLGLLILQEFKKELIGNMSMAKLLKVYAYGPPSSVDAKLAEFTESFVTTAVLHDDVVPRLTPTSCRGLLKHLLHIRETWVKAHLTDDLLAIGERASLAWAPRWRSGFTLTSSSLRRATLSRSSRSIKRYCQKQIKYGKKHLLAVKGKFLASATEGSPTMAEESLVEEKKQEANEEGRAIELSTYANDNGFEEESTLDNNSESGEPKFLVEMMGGLDNRTETIVIDGDEFFEADESLLESDEESMATAHTRVDALDEALSYERKHKPTPEKELEVVNQQCGSIILETSKVEDAEPECSDEDDGPGAVVLEEIPLPRMFVPGKIVHIYSHRGVFRAAYVPKDFRELRRLSLAGNMLTDHCVASYYEALLEVRSARNAVELPPKWTAFDEDDTCSCCASRFTWASTSDSEAQQARDKHNCRSCGTLVCNPCSLNRIPLPTIGLSVPVRVCDRCYNDLGGILTGHSVLTDSLVEESKRQDSHAFPSCAASVYACQQKPERKRERRSVVVDDLARRLQQSTFSD